MRRLMRAQQPLAGEAQRFGQPQRGVVLGIDLGNELARALGEQLRHQRGHAFARDAPPLPRGAGDVADLDHARLMPRHRDEAPRDRALRILGDPAAPVPCGIGEPAPQLGLVGEGGARQEAALRGIAQRGQQRGGVRTAQRAQREAWGVELGNRGHRRRSSAQRSRGKRLSRSSGRGPANC